MIMMTRYGHSEFCDDIRQEIDGKVSLIGVYVDDLIVERNFPVIISKLAIYTTLIEPIGDAAKPLTIKVFVPGENGDEVVIDADLPEDRDRGVGADEGECLYSSMSFVLTPLLIPREGRIKVRAYRGSEEIKLGTLLVTPKRKTAPRAVSLEFREPKEAPAVRE